MGSKGWPMQMSRDGTAGFFAFCISALQPPLADEIRRLPVAPALLSRLCFDLPAVAGGGVDLALLKAERALHWPLDDNF